MAAVDLSGYLSQLDLGANVHLLLATASHKGPGSRVKVIVDTPEGITVDQIARIGKLLRIDPELAQELDGPDFQIEVTSPGVGSGLEKPWQYPRHIGRRLEVRLKPVVTEVADPVLIAGRLTAAGSAGIELETTAGSQLLSWEQIDMARVVLNW